MKIYSIYSTYGSDGHFTPYEALTIYTDQKAALKDFVNEVSDSIISWEENQGDYNITLENNGFYATDSCSNKFEQITLCEHELVEGTKLKMLEIWGD